MAFTISATSTPSIQCRCSTRLAGCFLLFCVNQLLAAPIGLSTRDQNPILQGYYLPSINLTSGQGWQFTHTAYITNTFHNNQTGKETLILDVENYRYDLFVAYQRNNWRLGATMPLIVNDGGQLDSAIEGWHDLFGLPQGGRSAQPRNQVNITYIRDGQTFLRQTRASNATGDLAVSLSYLLANTGSSAGDVSFAIDLPTGSSDNNSGNEAIDLALWLSQSYTLQDQSYLYGLFGISMLGKGGQLASLQKSTVWAGQLGLGYALYPDRVAILQLDAHSAIIGGSHLRALGNSCQIQIGLRLKRFFEKRTVDLFFSEDILAGSAPDITFGIRIYQAE